LQSNIGKQLTQDQLNKAWQIRDKCVSGVVWFKNRQGQDDDFMTIAFDGQPARTFKRKVGRNEWTEVHG
jgi:uncharacterized protein YeaC (DUF1315 family)